MILNLSKNNIVSSNPFFYKRNIFPFSCLLTNKLKRYDGVVFQNCNILLCFLLNQKFDIIYLDEENTVCKVNKNNKIFNFLNLCKNAKYIICIRSGDAERLNIECEDILTLNIELSENCKIKLRKDFSRTIVSSPGVVTEK